MAEIGGILGDPIQANGVPGYAMCIVKDGIVVYSKGFGVAELGGDQLVTPSPDGSGRRDLCLAGHPRMKVQVIGWVSYPV